MKGLVSDLFSHLSFLEVVDDRPPPVLLHHDRAKVGALHHVQDLGGPEFKKKCVKARLHNTVTLSHFLSNTVRVSTNTHVQFLYRNFFSNASTNGC